MIPIKINGAGERMVVCHFTTEELEYFNALMARDRILTGHISESFKDLECIGVKLEELPRPNVLGKLLAYIKTGRAS